MVFEDCLGTYIYICCRKWGDVVSGESVCRAIMVAKIHFEELACSASVKILLYRLCSWSSRSVEVCLCGGRGMRYARDISGGDLRGWRSCTNLGM